MKKLLYIVAVAAVAAACTAKNAESEGTGLLSLTAAREGIYAATKANDVLADFVVDIVRPSDGWTKHFDHYLDIPQTVSLGSGDYTITVASPEKRDAAWNLPYYEGSASFTIRVDELTPVNVTATLQNMKVSFVLTDSFKSELTSYTIVVTNASSWDAADAAQKSLTWDSKTGDVEQTSGYFSVAPLRVKVDGYRAIDQSETHSELFISEVAAQDHHIITLDARVTGQLNGISITIDPTVNDRESDVEVPGWEEVPVDGGNNSGDDDPTDEPGNPSIDPQPSTAPTMTWEANPTFAPTPIASNMDVEIAIEVSEGIKDFVVDVDSYILGETIAALAGQTYTYSADTPYTMDLINDEAVITALGGMIPAGDALKDKTHVDFSLSQLVPLINVYSPESGSQHTFTLKVTDKKGQSLEQAVVFYAE